MANAKSADEKIADARDAGERAKTALMAFQSLLGEQLQLTGADTWRRAVDSTTKTCQFIDEMVQALSKEYQAGH